VIKLYLFNQQPFLLLSFSFSPFLERKKPTSSRKKAMATNERTAESSVFYVIQKYVRLTTKHSHSSRK
jgi:hypothetical protein